MSHRTEVAMTLIEEIDDRLLDDVLVQQTRARRIYESTRRLQGGPEEPEYVSVFQESGAYHAAEARRAYDRLMCFRRLVAELPELDSDDPVDSVHPSEAP